MILNMSSSEIAAIKALDEGDVDALIEKAIAEEDASILDSAQFHRCGEGLASSARRFRAAIGRVQKAKSWKKKQELLEDARKAGSVLSFDLANVKDRAIREEAERETFFIEDGISPPYRFSRDMSVSISYRWRAAPEADWNYATLTVRHSVRPPSFLVAAEQKAKKMSAARREKAEQDSLQRTWERLRSTALFSLKEYLQSGRDRSRIPKEFTARSDKYTGHLNNYSVRFWIEDENA